MTRNGLIRATLVGVFFLCGTAFAQKAPAKLAFQVATVNPSPLSMAKLMAEVRAGKIPRLGPYIDGALAIFKISEP